MNARQAILFTVVSTILGGGIPAAAQDAKAPSQSVSEYSVKPSDVALPADVPLGQYRRIFQPFPNWTLVCDENLKAKRSVCNVSQTVIDKSGKTAFSWSLAAEQSGRPFMILRTARDAKTDTPIELRFPGVKAPVKVTFDGCDASVCLGKTLVGPVLSGQIEKGAVATVIYRTTAGNVITLPAPLRGLKEAVASIK